MTVLMTRICQNCYYEFSARRADVARGWALYCSKSCKALDQERDKREASGKRKKIKR